MERRKSLGSNPTCMLDLQFAVLLLSMEITMIVLRMSNLQVLKSPKKHKCIFHELRMDYDCSHYWNWQFFLSSFKIVFLHEKDNFYIQGEPWMMWFFATCCRGRLARPEFDVYISITSQPGYIFQKTTSLTVLTVHTKSWLKDKRVGV